MGTYWFIRVTWSVAKVVCDTNPGRTMRWDCYKTSSLILNFSLASSMFPLEALACMFSYPGKEGYDPIAVLRRSNLAYNEPARAGQDRNTKIQHRYPGEDSRGPI